MKTTARRNNTHQIESRNATLRRRQLLVLLIAAAVILIASILLAGRRNIFLPNWWRIDLP